MGDIKQSEKRAEELRAENEQLDQELSKAEKKAAIAEAKKQYGPSWRKILGMGKLKINKETMLTLHSMGSNESELRNLNNPAFLQRRH